MRIVVFNKQTSKKQLFSVDDILLCSSCLLPVAKMENPVGTLHVNCFTHKFEISGASDISASFVMWHLMSDLSGRCVASSSRR